MAGMHRIPTVVVLMIAICLAETAFSCEENSDSVCPDKQALQLLAIAYNANHPNNGLRNPISAYTYVIKNATRPMDEVALRSACFGLARYSYMAERPEIYGPGSLTDGRPVPPKAAVESLLAKHPILETLPGECDLCDTASNKKAHL